MAGYDIRLPHFVGKECAIVALEIYCSILECGAMQYYQAATLSQYQPILIM